MYLFIISIVLFLVGIRLFRSYRTEEVGFIFLVVFSISLLIQLIMFTNHYSVKKRVAEREAFRVTLDNARANGTELENATILKDVAEWNEWLVGVKMDNEFWYDMYIPNDVDTMTLLK